MPEDDGFDRMVRAAIHAHQLLGSHGTPVMQFLSRVLLIEIGRELAMRGESDAAANDNPDEAED